MTLSRDMVSDPRQWDLVLELGSDTLSAMVFSRLEYQSMITAEIPLTAGNGVAATASGGVYAGFQEGVYRNPLLLSDFRKVTVLVDSPRYLLLPAEVEDERLVEELFRRAFPAGETGETEQLLINDLPGLDCRMVFALPEKTLGFIRRTFNNPEVMHPLVALARYFRSRCNGRTRGKMLVNLVEGRTDIVILGDNAPLLVNSYRVREPMDTLYYVMAARESVRLGASDELILAGDTRRRGEVAPLLRRYIRYVMPAIIPSAMLKAGRAALSTPFELVVTPMVTPV